MGNKKNRINIHICHGKFKKWKVKKRQPVETTNESTLNGSRNINLKKLQNHLQDVINHTATCHSSVNKPKTQHNIVMKEQREKDYLQYLPLTVQAVTLILTLQHHER